MIEGLFIYLALGLIAGATAGLLGLGGGVIIVPALYMLFGAQGLPSEQVMHMAIGTSLATIIFTSLSSIYSHHQQGSVQWPQLRQLLPGIILGVVAGSLMADQLESRTLRILFGFFELLVAAQILFSLIPKSPRSAHSRWVYSVAGSATGAVSALLGIGGGSLMVPFLSWCGVNMRRAVATSAACGFPIALVGTASFIWLGEANHQQALPWAVGYIYLPALAGILLTSLLTARLSAQRVHKIPQLILKRIFAAVLVLVGLKMILG
ncbi:MAG: sulfite exporter TauE/SafE family protein [Gammaproteobacteria bacterium]|nr:sulfite exporter TauE/SafE family protein [Gammaproteobacteria bacterium]MCF6230635.1 sulfite exporter TauE/SafE family protein [Gammaproteobacteria bacterium]